MEIICTHQGADFDGLASMVAAQKLYPGAILIAPGGCQPPVRAYLQDFPLPIRSRLDVDASAVTRVIIVDTQEPARLGPLQALLWQPHISVHVYDHHPADIGALPLLQADYRAIEPLGATTTLLVERIQKRQITLTPSEATLLAMGLYEETGSLSYAGTTPRDLYAAAYLLECGADLQKVMAYTKPSLTAAQIELLSAMIQASHVLYLGKKRILLTLIAWPFYVSDIAPLVHHLLKLQGADAILAAVAMEGKIQFIARSQHEDIDVQHIAQALGGGGHRLAAAASLKDVTLPQVEQRLREELEKQAATWCPIKQLMTTPVQTIRAGATVKEAERRLTQYEVNALPVVDPAMCFLGLITRESVQKALFHGLDCLRVEDIMLQDIFLATPETGFEVVHRQMLDRNQRVVPIVDDVNRVVGIFSRTDLLRTLHDDMMHHASGSRFAEYGAELSHCDTKNLMNVIKERLPDSVQTLLRSTGQVGDELGCSVYLVGGIVRDLLLGIPNFDVDIVVEGDGIAFGKRLGERLGAKVVVHERFGTAALKLSREAAYPPGLTLDIATARTEHYEYPTALPTVERSSIKKDLYRRDFTINALAVRLNRHAGELLDFFGGRRDIKDRVIRVLHSLSIVEDPTRAFRAVRFEQRFGFTISKETRAFIENAVRMDLFHRLSGHRLGDEMIHLLEEAMPANALQRLHELHLLRFVHSNLEWSVQLKRVCQDIGEILTWHAVDCPSEPRKAWIPYALALFEQLGPQEATAVWNRLGFPGSFVPIMAEFLSSYHKLLHDLMQASLTPAHIYERLHPWPIECHIFLMAKMKTLADPNQQVGMQRIKEYLLTLRRMSPLVTGHDLHALGLRKGPAYRTILDRLLKARLNEEVRTREEALALARDLVAAERQPAESSPSTSVP